MKTLEILQLTLDTSRPEIDLKYGNFDTNFNHMVYCKPNTQLNLEIIGRVSVITYTCSNYHKCKQIHKSLQYELLIC